MAPRVSALDSWVAKWRLVRMNFPEYFLGGLLSGGTVLAVGLYMFQASFTRLLDKRIEMFKQQLQVDAKVRELTLKSQIDFKERQLGELYGPIYALLKRGQPIYALFATGRLSEIEESVSKLFIETNETITRTILEKSHLIDGPSIPESFTLFLTHVAVWHGYVGTRHGGVPYTKEEFPEAYYPDAFEREVFTTTERLKRELYALHGKYGLLTSVHDA